MTRDLTTDVATKAVATEGVEPLTIVKVQWGGSIGTLYYADRDLTVGSITALGRVVGLGVDGATAGDRGPGTVQEASVRLVDPDQVLRGYTNQVVLDGLAVTIYHWYGSLAEVDLVELVDGFVRGPISWEEGERVLSFRVERALADEVLTYTPEAGEVTGLPEESDGKTWPLAFGTVIDVPAVRIERGPRGSLKEAINIDNQVIEITGGENFPQDESITIRIGSVLATGRFYEETFSVEEWNVARYESVIPAARVIGDPDEDNQRVLWLQDSSQEVLDLTLTVVTSVGMEGVRTSNPIVAQQGNKIWAVYPWGVLLNDTDPTFVARAVARANAPGITLWFIKEGAPVRQIDQEDVYVANDTTSNGLLRVQAFKEYVDPEGVTQSALVPVPSNFYSYNLADTKAGRPVTTVSFAVPLQDRDKSWKDETIYVTLRSTRSSNPATVIEWLLLDRAGYSSGEIDADSFASAVTALTNYPAHFAMLEPRTIAALLDFAEQSRCVLSWQNNLWKIRYMSTDPGAGDGTSLSDANITMGAINISATARESSDRWTTRLVGTYRDSYAEIEKRILDENAAAQALYGVVEETIDFWGLQTAAMVTKTLEFMIARRSRIWKQTQVETQLNALAVEVHDYVELEMTDLWPSGTLGLVRGVNHATDAETIILDLWLPIEEGTAVESGSAFLDDSGDSAPADPGAGITEGDPQILRVSFSEQYLTAPGVEETEPAESVPGIVLSLAEAGLYNVRLYPDGLDGTPREIVVARALDNAKPPVSSEVMCTVVSGVWHFQYSGATAQMAMYRFKSMASNHIICRTWDGSTEGTEDVLIAKPYLLRRTPFDGETRGFVTYAYNSDITRTAWDDPEDIDNQVISPAYVINDIIYATRSIEGGTAVTVTAETIEWLDINADGRVWERTAAQVSQYRIKSVGADHLVCRTWDGTTEGTLDLLVAKPYLLRRTPFDGQTRDGITYTYSSDIAREADDGSTTETQVVVPSWVADDIIYATREVQGGVEAEGGGEELFWVDDNRDGRAWAKEAP